MRLQIIKYQNDEAETRWKITKDGQFISCYLSEDEAIEQFDKMAERLRNPQPTDEIIKSIEI